MKLKIDGVQSAYDGSTDEMSRRQDRYPEEILKVLAELRGPSLNDQERIHLRQVN